MSIVEKIVAKTTTRIATAAGLSRSRFLSRTNALHVFCYHTIIPDELADRGWTASHAVTVSAFERQMAMLADLNCCRRLGDAAKMMAADRPINGPCIAITFDDGLADNVMLALPILQKYGLTATFFLATGCIDRDEFLAADKIRILRDAQRRGRLPTRLHPVCERLLSESSAYKSASMDEFRPFLDELWTTARHRVDPEALEACRMMRWDEARLLRDAGMEIGAHTVNHVILSREAGDVRQFEIVESVRRVRAEMRRVDVPFAFPNGQPADYDESDIDVLREIKTPYAVTTSSGCNLSTGELLRLRRDCVGLHHRPSDLWAALAAQSCAESSVRR